MGRKVYLYQVISRPSGPLLKINTRLEFPRHNFHEQGYTSIIHYTSRRYNRIFKILNVKSQLGDKKKRKQTLFTADEGDEVRQIFEDVAALQY